MAPQQGLDSANAQGPGQAVEPPNSLDLVVHGLQLEALGRCSILVGDFEDPPVRFII